MKNNIDNGIVDFRDSIDEKSVKVLLSTISAKVQLQQMKHVLISLTFCQYKENLESISLLTKEVSAFSLKTKISIDFIDYSEGLFVMLKKYTVNSGINLYKNKEIAALFMHIGTFKGETKILVYDDNEETSKKLYFDLCKYGYMIDRTQDEKEYLLKLENETYDVVVTNTFLNEKQDSKAQSAKKTSATKLNLSKDVIKNLPIFMNKASETLVSFTGLESHKVSHEIKKFEEKIDPKSITSLMHFNGDLEGCFTLVFPREIAMTALESLLGEKVQENDSETLTDGVGEFCNIITGAAKTEFDNLGIKVIFELPKTFASLKDARKKISYENGVWIDMELSGQPFYMFITK